MLDLHVPHGFDDELAHHDEGNHMRLIALAWLEVYAGVVDSMV